MKSSLLSSTTLVQSAAGNSSTFTGTGSVAMFAVTQTGSYIITAEGAQGGASTFALDSRTGAGGLGAEVSGTFNLVAGETIEIAVGVAGSAGTISAAGTAGYAGSAGGGGGATFVTLLDGSSPTLLEVAGGGGGSAYGYNGNDATAATPGSGSGGDYGGPSYSGGGGGGLDGSGKSAKGTGDGGAGQGVTAGLAGGTGGQDPYGSGGAGGFGGGGGGGAPSQYGNSGAGGGGGYTGGYAGSSTSSTPEGGSSFLASTATNSSETAGAESGNGLVTIVEQACFAAGTRIETERGPVAVELLRAGDHVRLAREDAFAPIQWIGHRLVDCACHPRPAAVLPVRVRAHAFGPGLPSRDLILSPDHAVFVDDVLIPVRHLMNGATILWERRPSVTYWHVELERHDVLLAEGLPCETYLDTGNRAAFANGGPVVNAHPQFDPVHAMDVWAADACAPLVTGGVERDAVHALLLATAADLGYQVTEDPALALLVDGRTIRPTHTERGLRFDLPDGARDIRLTSRRFVPAELLTGSGDHRALGAAITGLWVDGDYIDLTTLPIADGWFAPESDERAEWRWTDGGARLRRPGARMIDVESIGAGQYWTSPAIVAAEAIRAA